jgi:hypothetical protein
MVSSTEQDEEYDSPQLGLDYVPADLHEDDLGVYFIDKTDSSQVHYLEE